MAACMQGHGTDSAWPCLTPSCHAEQVLYTVWPPEAFAFNGATEHMPDGRLIFRGPRVAMAIHETEEFECGPAPSLLPASSGHLFHTLASMRQA